MLDAFQQNGFAPFKREWTAAHALHGKAVRVVHADGRTLEATVKDVADDGSLIVIAAGREINVSSGEISLRGVNK